MNRLVALMGQNEVYDLIHLPETEMRQTVSDAAAYCTPPLKSYEISSIIASLISRRNKQRSKENKQRSKELELSQGNHFD